MTYLLIGGIIGLVLGVILGAYIITHFDVVNSSYSIEKLKAKKHGRIDVDQLNDVNQEPKEKRKLFKRIFTHKNK
jgi:ABC-type lipoprotein release transport system permease subunit